MEPFCSSFYLETSASPPGGLSYLLPRAVLVPRRWDAGSYPQGVIICEYILKKETWENPAQCFGALDSAVPDDLISDGPLDFGIR